MVRWLGRGRRNTYYVLICQQKKWLLGDKMWTVYIPKPLMHKTLNNLTFNFRKMLNASTQCYNASTQRNNASTQRYNASTQRNNPSTQRYNASTQRNNASTQRYNASTLTKLLYPALHTLPFLPK